MSQPPQPPQQPPRQQWTPQPPPQVPSPPPAEAGERRTLLAREPVVITNVIAALAIAVCSLLREFGLPVTDGQQTAIVGVVGAVGVVIAALVARHYTTPLTDPRDQLGRPLATLPPARGGAR